MSCGSLDKLLHAPLPPMACLSLGRRTILTSREGSEDQMKWLREVAGSRGHDVPLGVEHACGRGRE